jgi:DNA ligase (NAD+)
MQLRCVNPDCGARNVRKLMHWASRSGADIDAIGENWIEEFSQAGLLNSIRDFYLLTGEDMLQFDNMGIERACKFMDSIEASKQVGMKKALIGLSIPQLGEGTATRLCNEFASVAEVMNATMADLWAVQDIGPSAASAISDHFRDGEVREVIIALIDLGVNLDRLPEDAPLELVSDAVFSGKTVVITGSLSVERGDFKKLLEAHGAKVTGSVSKKTDFLVIGNNVGQNKINAAKKNGTAVIDEATARQAMNL